MGARKTRDLFFIFNVRSNFYLQYRRAAGAMELSTNQEVGHGYQARDRTADIACYNMLDPKSSMLKNVLFSGSYQSYNERVIGLSKHCLS